LGFLSLSLITAWYIGQNRSGDPYLFAANQGGLRETMAFEGSIHGSHHTGMDQLLVDALLDREEAQYRLSGGGHGTENGGGNVDLHEDLLGDDDGLFVEEQPGSDSPSGLYTPADLATVNPHDSKDNESFDDADFEIAVDQQGLQEQELHGDFLPESVDGEVEIATEHLHLAEDVAFFTTRTVMDNSHERLIDDDTLNRLKEEMKRMDEEKARFRANGSQTPNEQSTRGSPLQAVQPIESPDVKQQIRYATTQQIIIKPSPSTVRNNILPSTSLIGGTSSAVSVNGSDASPQSEASGHPQQKPSRRHLSDKRRDSVGSSSSRSHNLIPLCEDTGKRMMMKDRMDQLAVSRASGTKFVEADDMHDFIALDPKHSMYDILNIKMYADMSCSRVDASRMGRG
jgi:hypothetical protein